MSNKLNAWQKLLKWLKYGSKALSVLVAGVSLALGIYSAVIANDPNVVGLDWRIVITIIVFNSIFLIGAAIYECVFFVISKNIKTEKDKLAIELDNKKNEIQLKNDYIGELLDFSSYINLEYNKEYNKIAGLHKIFKNDIEEKSLQSVFQQIDFNNPTEINTMIVYVENFKKGIIKSFNEFAGFVIEELKEIINKALKQKGLDLTCSITIKQMDDSYFDDSSYNYKDVKIITCYRDSEAYIHKKREVSKKIYSIENNTDFLECLQHDYFIKNNLTGVNATYHNENGDFLNYYNCTIVVPIFGLYRTIKCYFGYLACDTLNQNKDCDKVLDEEMVKIMKMTAILLGGYFEEHCHLWNNTIDSLNEFLATTDIKNKQLSAIVNENNFIKMLYNHNIKLNQQTNLQNLKKKNKRTRK